MAIYDKNNNTLIIAESELYIKQLQTKEEVFQLGFDAGYQDGYEEGLEACTE